jgi:hypothetical protein
MYLRASACSQELEASEKGGRLGDMRATRGRRANGGNERPGFLSEREALAPFVECFERHPQDGHPRAVHHASRFPFYE